MARSGTCALTLLTTPLKGTLLQALSEGPERLVDLRAQCGSPSPTTLRSHLDGLEDVGAITRRIRKHPPLSHECELTDAGRGLLFVTGVLERWLQEAPQGPLPLKDDAAKPPIKALVEGYSSQMLRVFAVAPVALTELDGVIGSLSYRALERRLSAMHRAGLVEVRPASERGTTPYRATEWLRRAVGPLAAAARWERRHLPAQPAITAIDIETVFLLALPLLRLPDEISGSFRMGVEVGGEREHRVAGVTAVAENGVVTTSTVRRDRNVRAWSIGSASAWLDAVVTGTGTDGLELGGDQKLARGLLEAFHRTLFGGSLRVRA